MAEDKMKGNVEEEASLATSFFYFGAVMTPCIASLFSNLNFLEAGEQTMAGGWGR